MHKSKSSEIKTRSSYIVWLLNVMRVIVKVVGLISTSKMSKIVAGIASIKSKGIKSSVGKIGVCRSISSDIKTTGNEISKSSMTNQS